MNKFYLFILLTVFGKLLTAQNYTILGGATSFGGCNCYRLTVDAENQSGAIFQNQTINLNNSFDYSFDIFLGCNNGSGADGLTFALTSNPNGLGSAGGGLGYAGGSQPYSLAVEFDTYQNTSSGDPGYAHIGIHSAGNINHNVSPPVAALTNQGNIDDCQTHTVRVVWNVNNSTYTVYFDGVIRQNIAIPNIVATYFNGNPIVNWGWTAATGGGTNEQRVCVKTTSSWVAGVNYQSCNKTMQFNDISTSNVGSVLSWAWNFGDGGTSTLQNPTHTYAAYTTYNVSLTITDVNGCPTTYSKPVTINPPITLTPTLTQPPCNGGLNGAVSLAPSGGFGPSAGYGGYMYSYNGGPPTSINVRNGGAGTYNVSVTDGVCSTTANYTLSEPPPLTATVSKTDASCGLSNGSATVTIAGGTPPYQGISWGSGFPAGASVSNLYPGTYIVDFKDANLCSSLLQYKAVIGSLPCGVSSSIASTNVNCFGKSTGSATLTVTGSTNPVTINWSNGASGYSITNVPAGNYTYNYSDGAGKTFSGSVTITQPSAVMTTTIGTINTSCAGKTDGQATISVTAGGNPAYTYLWGGGQTTAGISGLSAGPINVTVTDSKGCTAVNNATISGPTALNLNITKVNDSCYQSNTGSAMANVTGGNPPYTYYWDNISSAQNNLSLGAGTYSLTVTDSKGCTITGNTTLTEPGPFTHTLTAQNVKCFGQTSGSINIVTTGGVPTITYAWNPASVTGSSPANLAAGKYNVTIQDGNNCKRLDSATITQPATALTASSSHTNVSCNGAADGTLTVTIAGGVPPYTFQGNPVPAGTTTIPGRAPGTYAGNVTDANTCTVALSEVITEPAVLTVTETHVNVLCNGAASGSIDVTVTGGTTPYTYNWGTVTTEDRTALGPGTYNLTVTDAKNCTKTLSVTITESPLLVLTETHVNVLCNGAATGSIDLTVSGGATPYTYIWNTGATTQDINGLTAGTYVPTCTDANSCTKTLSIVITEPTLLTATSAHTNVTCNGAANGTLTITVGGGTPPYTFLGNPVPAGTTTVPGRAPGTYAGNLTDANGCTVALTETITEPAVLAATETHVNVLCNGASTGSIDVTVTGGTIPYTYNWGTVTTEDRTGLAVGTYSLTVTDANSCTTTLSVTITEPTAIAITETHVNVLCNGGATGSIDATTTGGVTPYAFAWSNGATTEDVSGLIAGTYILTVTDANSCTKTLSVVITEPTLLTATSAHTNVTCNGAANGTLTITVGGGTPPYAFLGNPVPAGTTTVPGRAPGTYAGNLTDANGCTVALTETITEPAVLAATETHVNVLCNGASTGSIDVTVTGGTTPYTYNWGTVTTEDRTGLAVGTYSLTVTDANSCTTTLSVTITEPTAIAITETHVNVLCNGGATGSIDASTIGGVTPYTFAWSNGATTEDITGLIAGTYILTVTDANSCTKTLSVVITEPTLLTATSAHTNVTCNGAANGTLTITVGGGTPPYSFLGNPVPAGTTTVHGQAPGTYAGNLTDVNGCTVALTETITEPAVLDATATQVNVLCNGAATGSIDVTVTGGTTPYSYNWGTVTTEDRTALTAGTYDLTITDANSCTKTLSVTITEPTALVVTETHLDLPCNGSGTGSIDVTVSGGTAAYTYLWNDAVTTEDRTAIPAGTYTVTVTDANGCTKTISVTIIEPAVLTATTSHTDVTCYNAANGTITITVGGGTPPFTFLGNPVPAGTSTVPGLAPNTYAGNVTDSRGCTAAVSETITQPQPQSLALNSTDNSCNGGTSGDASANFINATGAVTYNWTGPRTGSSITGLSAGTYVVTATDANSCILIDSVTINDPAPQVLPVTATDATCFGGNGSATANPTVGTAPYTYTWSAAGTGNTQTITPFAGTYSVTAADAGGCRQTGTFTIAEPTQITTQETHTNPLCAGATTGTITITATGGTPGTGYTYSWQPAIGSGNTATAVGAGNYSVIVSDANSCTQAQSITVTEPLPVTVSATSTPASCFGDADGTIATNIAGGTAPYSYVASDGVNTYNSGSGTFANVVGGTYTIVATDANGCTAINTILVDQPTEIVSAIAATDAKCFNSTNGTLVLTTSGGNPTYSYSFSGGQNNTSGILTGLAAGNYSVTVTDGKGCSTVETATINQPDTVLTFVSPSPIALNLGESLELSATSNQPGNVTYLWSPSQGLSCTSCDNPVFTGIYSQKYAVTAVTDSGCTGTDTFEVTVVANYDLFVPNTFSPNGDGQNDTWQIFGITKAVKRFEVQVFNRWGELVYQSNDPTFVWDGYSHGVKLDPDVYVYIAKYTWLDNHTNNDYKGTLTLIR